MTHPEATKTVPRLTFKDQKMGGGPIPEISAPSLDMFGIILPLISQGNYPAHKREPRHILRPFSPERWPTVRLWGEGFSQINPLSPITLSLTGFFLWWDIKNQSVIRVLNQVCDLTGRLWVLAGMESQDMGSSLNLRQIVSTSSSPVSQFPYLRIWVILDSS